MGLGLDTDFGQGFYKLLDDMSLDETTRKNVQEKAFRLLHLRPDEPATDQ